MERIEYKYGDKPNLTPLLGVGIGFILLTAFFNTSTLITYLSGLIILFSLYKLTFSTNKKGSLIIEDGKLIKTNFIGYTSEIVLNRYENFGLGRYTSGNIIVATHKKTKMLSTLLGDKYDKPIESIFDTIMTVLDGTHIETPKVKVETPVDEYAYNPDDYKI